MLHYAAKIALCLSFSITLASAPLAEEIDTPSGDVILTVSGEIATVNQGQALVLDREMLKELPATTIETSTIWTEGKHSFTGVSLFDFANAFEIEARLFLATAINDYTVEIPVSDAVDGGAIIAYMMDGEEMSIRDKGPLWVIYPYDRDSAYRSEVIYSRSIWQLDRLEIVQ